MKTGAIIDFIVRDAKAGGKTASWRFVMMSISIAVPIFVVAFLGFNAPFDASARVRVSVATTVFLFVLALLPFALSRRQLYQKSFQHLLVVAFSLVAAAVFLRLLPWSTAYTGYDSLTVHLACFLVGFATSALVFCLQFIVARLWAPVPDTATRLTMAIGTGVAGLWALELHCESLSAFHLALSHLGHCFVIAPLALVVLNWDAERRLRNVRTPRAQFGA